MAKSIMIQGTMSGVGKSLLVAGLCRVFAQDGLAVAPFKSQNMALNSGICSDGSEIGRAQVMQAQAAGIEPEAAMNPILLKPTTDTGSQVIVGGRARQTMSARDYFAYKRQLVPDIRRAYDDLANRFDVIVTDGFAGNIAVKTIEGTAKYILAEVKRATRESKRALLGAGLLKPSLKRVAAGLSGDEYGGAALLGVKAPVFIGHGATSVDAVKHGTLACAAAVRGELVDKIARAVAEDQ